MPLVGNGSAGNDSAEGNADETAFLLQDLESPGPVHKSKNQEAVKKEDAEGDDDNVSREAIRKMSGINQGVSAHAL
jgi:hypothetical protein